MIVALLLACTDGGPLDGPEPVGTTSTPAPDPVEELLEDLLTGDDGASGAIAWSSGFPVDLGDTIAFVYRADEGGGCAVAGDFNGWTEQPMENTGPYWYHREPVASFEAGLAYKYVCDDGVYRADPMARAFGYDAFGEISFARPPEPKHLERWPDMPATGLAARDLTVLVPAGDGPFDVLYAADGQNLFNPDAINGGWQMSQAVGDRPILVVGVHNTPDRLSEYGHVDDFALGSPVPGMGDTYAAFVHTEVRPHIEASYPTSGHDGLIGSSMGGLISMNIAQTYPGAYDFVACMSGTLGWGRLGDGYHNQLMLERWLAAPPDLVVYADTGGGAGDDGLCTDPDGDGYPVDDPDDSDNYCVTRQFVDSLAENGFTWDDDLFHWHEPGAPHSETAWAARVHRPLSIFRPE